MMDGMGDCNALAVAPNTGYAKGSPAGAPTGGPISLIHWNLESPSTITNVVNPGHCPTSASTYLMWVEVKEHP